MYLASPMHGDSSNLDDDDDDDDGEVDGGSCAIVSQSSGAADGKEDDDSMASDASSGTPYKQWHDDGMYHVKHGKVSGDVVLEKKNSKCSSRYSWKNYKVERKEEKGVLLSRPSMKEDNGDSISIHGSSKMRRVKSNDK